jgi:hypothetical protein
MRLLSTSLFVTALLALLSGTAHARFRFDPVTAHPSRPQIGQPILLLVRSTWSDGCGGTLDVRVNPERIDLIQIPRRDPGIVCAAVVQPLNAIINPQERLNLGARLANRVEVRFFTRNADSTDALQDTDIVEFTNSAPKSSPLLSGSFSAPTLDISGLFIDRQEGVISTLLSDYDEQGRSSWRFGAGRMQGDTYIGELRRYTQIRCITAPCPRSISDAVGTINLIAVNANELFVSYRNALSPDVAGIDTHRYERLVFNRAATLPGANSPDSWLPDLVGEWLIGVTGNRQESAEFKRYSVSYLGVPLADPASFDRRFRVEAVTNAADSFEIICSDERPVDGVQGCRLRNYRALTRTCEAFFLPTDVTLGNLRIAADCDSLETEFLMQRLGR